MNSRILLCGFLLFTSWVGSQLLYEIKSKDGLKTSYLFGTIHLMPAEQFVISPDLKKAFTTSSALAMEVDLNMDFSTKLDMARASMLPDGQTLKDFTTPQEFETLRQYCLDKKGMTQRKFNKYIRLKPFFFSSLLLQEDIKHSKSYELEFNRMAQKSEKKTMGLESVSVQMETINSVSIPNQVNMLMDGLSKPQEYDGMLNHYLMEDLNALYQDIVEESKDFPLFVEHFLNKRNRQWIPVIERQIDKEPTFIAVGAGHLPGEQGVVFLLSAKGYTLTPMFAFRK
jgi:uncharacterized protein YbaP (TraB family)